MQQVRQAHAEAALFLVFYRAVLSALRATQFPATEDDEADWAERLDRGVCKAARTEPTLYGQWQVGTRELRTDEEQQSLLPWATPITSLIARNIEGMIARMRGTRADREDASDPERLRSAITAAFDAVLKDLGANEKPPLTPEDFEALIGRVLAGDVRFAIDRATRLWGRGDAAKIHELVRFGVCQGPTSATRGPAGLGIGLETTGNAGLGGDIRLRIVWTLQEHVPGGKHSRRLGDFLLLTCAGISHEVACHVLETRRDPDSLGIARCGTHLHGWMTFVQVAFAAQPSGERDKVAAECRIRAARELLELKRDGGTEEAKVASFLTVSGSDVSGWFHAHYWYDQLSTSVFDRIDNTSNGFSATSCTYSSYAELRPYSVLHLLTRWGVRAQDGSAGCMCDVAQGGIESGQECPRLRELGRSLPQLLGDGDVAANLRSRANEALGIDLTHWA